MDLSAPLTFATGLKGNAPTVFGGNQANGNWTIGVGADIFQKYRVDLKYIDWFGRYRDNGPTAVTTQNGFHDPALRPRLREPDPQDHLLRRKQCISRRL